MKRKAYLIFELSGPILTFPIEKFQWRADLFYSLRTLSEEGLYTLGLLIPQELQLPTVEYIVQTLTNERIEIEQVVTDLSQLPKEEVNESLSYFISSNRSNETYPLNFLQFTSWPSLLNQFRHTKEKSRTAHINRVTRETRISISLDLDGSGKSSISTRLPFFDHMLDQIAKHSRMDLKVMCDGDIQVDEHHTVEDVAITLGQALSEALGDKRGISRYGSAIIPMDDVTATVAIDFSNRPYFVWDAHFSRDMVGTFPTEMVYHFFKSFSDEARCNLHMSVTEGNTHHQVEALFKGCARAIREAIFRYPGNRELPSTKGVL